MPPRLPGRHLLQVPGPTNVPESVRRAMDAPTIDHRGPEFGELVLGLLADIKTVFDSSSPVVMYPGSGTGAWEAALVNTLSPGDCVLSVETGHFASLWARLATRFGLEVETISTDWRSPVDPALISERLGADTNHDIKAVLVTHNETSTGVTSDIAEVRKAIDLVSHPALLFVDAVSSLASIEFHHDAWGVDVTVAASQKGLMLPPGLCFNAVSERALQASKHALLPRAYWDWQPILEANARGFFPYTPPTNLFFGLRAAMDALFAEGFPSIFRRHERHAFATRSAVTNWGLELWCRDDRSFSPTVTAILMPEEVREQEFRRVVHDEFGMSLGAGLGKLADRVFRVGHLGDFDDLTLMAVLAGIELGLSYAGVPHQEGGVAAALKALQTTRVEGPGS